MNPIAKCYHDFFFKTRNERLIFLRGGRRSGKTYAIFYKLLHIAEHGSGGDVLITSDTFPNLGKLVKDFTDITGQEPQYVIKNGEYRANYRNSMFRFRSFNRPQDAKGTKAKYCYINEADGVESNLFETLRLGIEKQIICDHNPTQKFWGTEMQNENNTLVTSFRDNSFLTPEQIADFEEIEMKGKNAPVGSVEFKRYANEILGEYSELGGLVFNKLYFIDEKEFDSKDFIKYLGLDFGDTIDPNALVAVKFDFENKRVYVKEEFYQTFVPDRLIGEKIKSIEETKSLIYENATGGNTRILNILQDKELKIKTIPIVKNSSAVSTVAASVYALAEWNIYVTGINAQNEFQNYKIADGKFTGEDHVIDAVRYVFIMVVLLKLVK
jgi:PBSX family phage terminase large subunit